MTNHLLIIHGSNACLNLRRNGIFKKLFINRYRKNSETIAIVLVVYQVAFIESLDLSYSRVLVPGSGSTRRGHGAVQKSWFT